MSGQAQRHTPGIRFTGRGAIVVMLVIFVLGLLGASWLSWPVLAGGSFLVGSVAAAWYVRPADLLTVAVTPPLLFGATLVGVKAVTATGNAALSIVGGTAITLAAAAPWLLAGTALSLLIAWSRGLRQCVRDLRRELRRSPGPPGPDAGRPGDPRAQNTLPPRR
jgi:hypothetical protein